MRADLPSHDRHFHPSPSRFEEGAPPTPFNQMAYNDLKRFQGQAYSGMSVGGEHRWIYPRGTWHEKKVAPDRWDFNFTSFKEREEGAPEGSGAPPGTQYHWYLLAHQRVKKIDQDTYATFMEGQKYKVAHRRPYWRHWSTEYPGQASERERLIAILEDALARLRERTHPLVPRGVAQG